jgi:hypothetical protein
MPVALSSLKGSLAPLRPSVYAATTGEKGTDYEFALTRSVRIRRINYCGAKSSSLSRYHLPPFRVRLNGEESYFHNSARYPVRFISSAKLLS